MKTLGRGLFVLAAVSLMAPVAAAAGGAPSAAGEPVMVDQAAPEEAALSEPQKAACTSEPPTEALPELEFGALESRLDSDSHHDEPCLDSGVPCGTDRFCQEEVCSLCECQGTCVLC